MNKKKNEKKFIERMAIRTCNMCKYSEICKHRESREQAMNDINERLIEFSERIPEWMSISLNNALLMCEDYMCKPARRRCKECSHCVKCEPYPYMGTHSKECDLGYWHNGTGQYSADQCDDFSEIGR